MVFCKLQITFHFTQFSLNMGYKSNEYWTTYPDGQATGATRWGYWPTGFCGSSGSMGWIPSLALSDIGEAMSEALLLWSPIWVGTAENAEQGNIMFQKDYNMWCMWKALFLIYH